MYSQNKSIFYGDTPKSEETAVQLPHYAETLLPHDGELRKDSAHVPGSKIHMVRMLQHQHKAIVVPVNPPRKSNQPEMPLQITTKKKTREGQVELQVKHTIDSRRKVYGVAPKPTLKTKSKLRVMPEVDKLKAALRHDESQIQDTMHRVGKNLPIQFLMESNHRDFALKMAAETVWRILVANWRETQDMAFQKWLVVMLRERQLDHDRKRKQLELQAGLSRCLRISQTNLHRYMQRSLVQWHEEAARRTRVKNERMILMIQLAWRRKLSRHTVEHMKARHKNIREYNAAVAIQRRARGMKDRRRARFLAHEKLVRESAAAIQRSFRRYVVVQMHRREVKKVKVGKIQRVYRGLLGRRRAHRRRQWVHEATTSEYNVQARVAVDHVTTFICGVLAIQRCIHHHLARRHMRVASAALALRKQFFPSRSWTRYRAATLARALECMVASLELIGKQLAKRVRRRAATLAEKKRQRGATRIQRHIRGFVARVRVNARQMDAWLALDSQLPRCEKQPLEWDDFTSTQALQCLVNWRGKVHRWRCYNAVQIQRIFRGYRKRTRFVVRQGACGDLRQLLNRPVHRFLRLKKARRVRGRWRRHRHATLAKTMMAWKGIVQALKRIKSLRTSERQRHIAQWHFEKKQRRKMLHHWQSCMRLQQGRAFRAGRGKAFRELKVKTQTMATWKGGTKDSIVRDVVWRATALVDMARRWMQYAVISRKSKQLRAKIHTRIKADLVNHWVQLYILMQVNRALACSLDTRMHQRAHVRAWHAFVGRRKTIDERYKRLGSQYGVREWIETVSAVKFHRGQQEKARLFRLAHLITQWRTLKGILLAKEALRQCMDQFANKQKQLRTLVQWLDFVDEARDYHALHAKAQRLFSRTFKRKAFAEWYKLWCDTAGRRRIESAIKVQKTWRGKKGRRRFANIKALHRYKIAKRIEGGVDAPECTPDTVEEMLRTKIWVLLFAYLPWQRPSQAVRRAFATVATHWYLRRKIAFGICNATQLDTNKSVSLASALRLQARLPSVSVFWHGRGPENMSTRDPLKRISRRFTKVDMQFTTVPLTVEAFQPWTETFIRQCRHATATDIQAIMRGCLVRMRIYYKTQYRHRDVAIKIVWWFVRYCRQRRKKNATKLQRWYRRRKAQYAAWLRAKACMVDLRKPIQLIQRVLRHYFRRVQFWRARDERLATTELYPNAPLCMSCEAKVAMTKCTDCDEPYCDDCFATFHIQGARVNHRSVAIDFAAMHQNKCMCRRCHVRTTRRVCEECKMGLCILCFEKVHSMRSGLHDHKFRRPAKILHDPKRAKKKPLSELLCCDLAQDVITQHQWLTRSRRDAEIAAVDKVIRDAELRKNKLDEICKMLERPVLDAFQLFDPNHEGFIGLGELRLLLTQELCIPVTRKEIEAMAKQIDDNGDGKLAWNEILKWLAVQIVDGTFRGNIRGIRRRKMHVQKKIRKTKQRYREVKRKVGARIPHQAKKHYVPNFDHVLQLHPVDDFQRQKHVLYRFLKDEFALSWILDDIHDIELENQMRVFADVFVPRWNKGKLGYEYYYDGVSFTHNSTLYEQKWDEETTKYVFLNLETNQMHLVDPRKQEVLYAMAWDAFQEVDVDQSGDIDVNELYTLLTENLCEPMSMHDVIATMQTIDRDGTGSIDFDEFFAWYGSEYSQLQVRSVKHDSLKLALRTRRNAKKIASKGYNAGLEHGKSMLKSFKSRIDQRRLEKDCENADPETVELLHEGFEKHMIQKALMINRNDVAQSRDWLEQKKQEAEFDAAHKRDIARRRREEQLQVLRTIQKSTKSGVGKVVTAIKIMLFGEKRNHDAEVDFILRNLKQEIEGARAIVKEEQEA
ncbi:Aste57867_9422 [Aphanomyces stellatus]|uniref:Aste57867_9422 protein n=1 Tax=Aphanomyces stellatus TaxID=120398 RepID=A0A485KMU3_9STRA|nr:hypothetical protein As57867_009386 [Aphanomyces stellatus]VFT86302.1 Aste57867_9422 [Aphanomyces stellatus]